MRGSNELEVQKEHIDIASKLVTAVILGFIGTLIIIPMFANVTVTFVVIVGSLILMALVILLGIQVLKQKILMKTLVHEEIRRCRANCVFTKRYEKKQKGGCCDEDIDYSLPDR